MEDNSKIDPVWQSSPPSGLEEERVHVWRANLNLPDSKIDPSIAILSPDEIARANKFCFDHHRRRFIATRAILRQLLGNYLQISPTNLQFEYGDRGKPLLAGSERDSSLQFNLSHSEEYAIFGFTYHYSIGVDLEYIKEMPDALKIAERFLSEQEHEMIKSAAVEEQASLFFKLWTAKEAYLKAIGTGLAGSLSSVNIALDSTKSLRLLAVDRDTEKVASWSLYSYIPVTNYIGAIALENPISFQQIDFCHWQG